VSAKQLKPYDLINPIVEIDGEKMALRLEQMAGVPAALLGDVVASVSEAEEAISVAFNRLLFYV
jgi:hypothetical protein